MPDETASATGPPTPSTGPACAHYYVVREGRRVCALCGEPEPQPEGTPPEGA